MVDNKKQKSIFKSSVSIVVIISTFLLSVYLVFGYVPTAHFKTDIAANLTLITFPEDNYTLLNISVNGTDAVNASGTTIREVNITVPANFVLSNLSRNDSTKAHDFSNISSAATNTYTFNGTNLSSNGTIDYFSVNISAPIPGNYSINITMRNGTVGTDENVWNSTINVTVNDTESGNIAFGVSTSANGTTVSRNHVYVNVSANQSEESTIRFELHNASGLVNITTYTNASRDFNWTAGTDGIGDGNYTYNVTINDTWGNSNTTATDRFVYIDTTNPTVSVSCDKTEYIEGDSITCSCSAGDNVNATPTSFPSTFSTATTGTFTYTCTVRDTIPNNGSASLTYTVTAFSGGSVGGGGASSITKTVTISDGDFKSGTTKALATNERFKFSVESKNHFATVKELTSLTAKIEVASSHPQSATLQIGDLRKFDVTGNGYYDLSVKLNSISGNKADLTIISINELITIEEETQQEESNVRAEIVEDTLIDQEANGNLNWLWILILVIVIILVIVFIIARNKRKNL